MTDLAQELQDARAREAATTEILRAINRSPDDYQPVFEAILEHATRLCDVSLGLLLLREGEGFRVVADRGVDAAASEALRSEPISSDPALSATAKSAAERRPFEILDAADAHAHGAGLPLRRKLVELEGLRTQLTVPMLRGDESLGVIIVFRREVRSFEAHHVELLSTFAGQAAIAVDNVRRFRALNESLERQTATSEILRVISRSPTDYQPVFDTILDNATRLCDAPLAMLVMRRDDGFHLVAHAGTRPEMVEFMLDNPIPFELSAGGTVRAAVDRRPNQLADITADAAYRDGLPHRRAAADIEGIRTALWVPMLKGDECVGVICVYRREVRPFDQGVVDLVSTFADQAVIAIDNVRLFQALEARTSELGESLERQTATSDILRVISRSPTDYQPVFDTILENATRLCDAPLAVLLIREGDRYHCVAHRGTRPEFIEWLKSNPVPTDARQSFTVLAADRGIPLHLPDMTDTEGYRDGRPHAVAGVKIEGIRTALFVPMMKGDECAGVFAIYRREVRPFDESHTALVSTFADQAVIAIDNVRLFQALEARTDELNEALERQTATSDILRTISRSPTDYQPVFETILENATRLCDAPLAILLMRREGAYHLVAHVGSRPEFVEFMRANPVPLDPEVTGIGQAGAERRPLQMADMTDTALYREGQPYRTISADVEGVRSALWVPMVKNDECVGVMCVYRREVRPFDESDVSLVSIFADQAVIAIDNVRLFQELETRNKEVTEALEQKTATSNVLQVISNSLTDVQPAFDTIVENAARLCEAEFSAVARFESGELHLKAVSNLSTEEASALHSLFPRAPSRGFVMGRAFVEGRPVHVEDCTQDPEYDPRTLQMMQNATQYRTFLGVPLLRDGVPIGVIGCGRRHVMPFSGTEIELVKTFAAQAVIAIENMRLFNEVETRNRELGESLERQTATSDILRTISRSPTDYGPVFDAILENSIRLCEAPLAFLMMREGDRLVLVAHKGSRPEFVEWFLANPMPMNSPLLGARAAAQGKPLQIADITDFENYRHYKLPHSMVAADIEDIRTMLCVPMMKGEDCVGVVAVYRREVRPFSESHIALVSTFADQAVIAIDNVRLFQALEARTGELGEALERQTATSDILRTISRSPTDYGPVFDAILESATRLCDAPLAFLQMREDDHFRLVAHKGSRSEFVEWLRANPISIKEGTTLAAQAAIEGVPKQLADVVDSEGYRDGLPHRVAAADIEGIRTTLFVPMMKGDKCVGEIAVYRREVRPFDESHIALLSTFADQAVIAIDNVRLFQALDERTRELARSVEELRALGEIGQAVNSTLDPEAVLDTIITQAVALTGTDGGVISEYDEATGTLPARAAPGFEVVLEGADPVRFGEGAIGRAAQTRAPVQIPDIDAPGAYMGRLRALLDRAGLKALLAVPLLREDRVLGALLVARKTPGEFPPGTVEILGTFAAQSALAIHNSRLFRELEEKGRELELANKHKSEFLANMSHELRTPLNAVIGFSEVLGEEMFGELNEKQKEYVEDIHSSGRHLLSLINDILDLSKIEAGRMELDVTTFDVRQALENALTLVTERAGRRGIALESEIDDALTEMTGDERKIKQILLNVLSNAVKFTPEGGKVTLTARGADSALVIAVRDTGVGIAAEDLEHIFEEFRQVGTDYARKVEGTGLGLTLTRRFIELHGGEIAVESEPGVGSEFRITLPLEPPVPAVAGADGG